jgi:hypothetical protein
MNPLLLNPQTLFMLVSVFQKNNEVPKSRGSLYEQFTATILAKEDKKSRKKETIENKKTVLSSLAYQMRQQGVLFLHEAQAKVIFKDTLGVNPNNLFQELLDSYLLCRDSNKLITFLHETYLEYYASIELQNQFINTKRLSIDLKNTKWTEPLLMCSDLLPILPSIEREVNLQYQFINYLFRGDDTTNRIAIEYDATLTTTPKLKIKDELSIEISDHILIGCKVAYNLKETYPVLFQQAERYLLNYITVWNKDLIALEDLFAAIGTLSSPSAFVKILFSPTWVSEWLADSEDYQEESPAGKIDRIEGRFLSLSEALIKNLNDVQLLYYITTEVLPYFIGKRESTLIAVPSARKRLIELSSLLVQYLPIEKTKKLFLDTQQEQLLINISKIDFEFFLEHYDFENWGYKSYIKLVSRYGAWRYTNLLQDKIVYLIAQKVELHNNKDYISGAVHVLTNTLLQKQEYNKLDALFEAILQAESKSLLNIVLTFVKRVPLQILPPVLKAYFEGRFNEKIEYPEIQVQPNSTFQHEEFYTLPYLDFFLDYNKPSKIYFIFEESLTENISHHLALVENTDLIVRINSRKVVFVTYSTVFKSSAVILKKGIHHSSKLEGKTSVWVASCSIVVGSSLIHSDGNLRIYSNLDNSILKEFIEIHSSSIKNITNYYGGIHPDLILSNDTRMQWFDKNIQKLEPVIRRLGLAYKFHEKIPYVNYGIIINIKGLIVRVYSIADKVDSFYTIYPDCIDKYSISQIVVIEANNTLGVISDDDRSAKIGFMEGQIITIHNEKNTGFIKNLSGGSEDYYFPLNEIDFIPKVSDKVSFIPAINLAVKYKDKLMARNVRKIDTANQISL